MEKDSGFGYHQHLNLMPPNPSLFGFPSDTGHLSTESVYRNPHFVEASTLRNVPLFASEPNNSQNWLYRMPHFHKAFPPAFDFGQQKSPITGPMPAPKRFLVFDQSGDRTTLMYSSGIQTPVQFGARFVPNPPATYNFSKEELRVSSNPLRLSINAENTENNSRDVTEDEMREDTEELNALLCSDNDTDFSEDDEETSTGHSPSTMTDNGVRDFVEEIGEEVDSFAGPTKRQKISDGGYTKVPSSYVRDVSSLKTFASSALEDDAESSCGDYFKQRKEGFKSCCKRSRKEKIHETLSVLQSVIPNVDGKDAVVVIDEAIQYLRSLKVKVKALGLDAL
ncbi:hypothetical protein DH2020_040207 [Rehmannia glutinosa]|uniref:BHLH domain-containing protein n=1 Tax=Rehmannia glutinosa TaxID=99300 RepID=A0ABR0UUZ4_REHGL